MSTVVTGEAVPLELRLAKFPSRSLGFAIDVLALGVVAVGVLYAAESVVGSLDTAAAQALGLATIVFLVVVVPTTVETLSRGRSLGKLAMGLRVVRDDGGPIRFRHALVRSLFGVFADFLLTAGAGAVICSLANEQGKRIGDLAAGTVVVRVRTIDTTGTPPPGPPQLREWAAGLELSRLDGGLALSARSFLVRAAQLTPQVRRRLGEQLANQVAAVVSPPPPFGVPAEAYLAAVLEERSRRAHARQTR